MNEDFHFVLTTFTSSYFISYQSIKTAEIYADNAFEFRTQRYIYMCI